MAVDEPGGAGMVSTASLTVRLREFTQARGWERVSTPTGLLLSLVSEVGEIAEHFRWLSTTEAARIMSDRPAADQIREELADVYWCLLRLADALDVDLAHALLDKLELMESRHPLDPEAGPPRQSPEPVG